MIDYRYLLKKYMQHIIEITGSDMLTYHEFGSDETFDVEGFSPREITELRKIAVEDVQ
jgi:hypothetical protein